MKELPAIADLSFGLLRGSIKAQDVVADIRDNIEKREVNINAYINHYIDQAETQARRADESGYPEDETADLKGIPVAVKDNICVKGWPCTCASNILNGFIPPYEATAVKRLREKGVILLGKTNLDEFAMGASNETSAYGPVRNPLDPGRVPGGSSGGSAAAVAYGGAVAALGSDTGGSIRQPASFCGLVGLRPSYGRVSRWGLVAFSSSLDQIGPITKTVEDAALLYSIIAGPDENDSTTCPQPPDEIRLTGRIPEGIKVGMITECFEEIKDSRIAEAVRSPFIKAGIDIQEISIPLVRLSVAGYYLLVVSEASSNLARYDGIRYGKRISKLGLTETYFATRSQGFGDEVTRRILLGTFGLSAGYIDAYYNTALSYRAELAKQFKKAFDEVDFLLTPTTPTVAFKLGEKIQDPLDMYLSDIFTASSALAALPSISIPAPDKVDGLPVGIQLIAPRWKDSELLEFAHAVEKI
ncbi:Asp-tRNA(Asn)/Glu-tRNA(Gln) amidotransferase subunit GatA [candidate division WOR-3 bacterium]|uniref:Glutamyl-tRNA(Gln) amidotransferase subunit A n=1 Tax=candidate division WOR-3 bacterium TaxID=2052148 RepID=A0A9D5K8Y2_UNCW3|nr:Asp-tRNA(Asn)/Glu-tRNA(Gln) amidotransferase subunit GatA [candidate division WOR-3 bacterium]MBD3364537.1 Asp-tRNA(Asn)/Glu-tRNA(Gln) amidotransferase subunit GatA [candidate division WOR-3 bacterium]